MRMRHLLAEAFDSYYRVTKSSPTEFEFVTDTNSVYEINFHKPSYPTMFIQQWEKRLDTDIPSISTFYEVDFLLRRTSDGQEVHGYKYVGVKKTEEDAMKVFGTVLNTVFWYVREKNLDALFFSGTSQLGAVYTRMIKRYMPNHYTMVSNTRGTETYFMIIKKEYMESEA